MKPRTLDNWRIVGLCVFLLAGACAGEDSPDNSLDTGAATSADSTGTASDTMSSGAGTGGTMGGGAMTGGGDTSSSASTGSTSTAAGSSTTTGQSTAQPTSTADGAGGGATNAQATCSASIQSGSPCQPETDTTVCEASSGDCTCAANAEWTCAEAPGSGGMGGDGMGGDGMGGDDMGAGGMGAGGMGGDPPATGTEWLPSWSTTLQRTEDSNEPPPLGGKTLRQFIYPSYSGSEIRIELSNERGNAPADISKVHIAVAAPLGQGQIDAATDAVFTFDGSPGVTIAQGERVWSDPLPFELTETQPMAVTMHFNSAPTDVTGHPGARTTSYVADGDVVSDASVSGETRDRWYFISTIDVMAPSDAYAVAVLGDSITDGYGVLNEFARWPDYLNAAINQDPKIADKVSVLNFGMGANSLTSGNADMDPGTERFERDVLGRQDKIRWLIVLIGVNDLIYGGSSAGPITSAYQDIIDRSHEAGILVYGSPITPFASHTQGSPLSVRTEVNSWVTTSNAYDAVVDLAAAVADPNNTEQLSSPLSNDGLHPSTAGYEAMAGAVDLSLFYETMQ